MGEYYSQCGNNIFPTLTAGIYTYILYTYVAEMNMLLLYFYY